MLSHPTHHLIITAHASADGQTRYIAESVTHRTAIDGYLFETTVSTTCSDTFPLHLVARRIGADCSVHIRCVTR